MRAREKRRAERHYRARGLPDANEPTIDEAFEQAERLGIEIQTVLLAEWEDDELEGEMEELAATAYANPLWVPLAAFVGVALLACLMAPYF